MTGNGLPARGRPDQQRRLAALYARATCLVVPTTFEPRHRARGGRRGRVPSIGSARGGAADMIGPAGSTAAPGDVPEALVAAMDRMATQRRPAAWARQGWSGPGCSRGTSWRTACFRPAVCNRTTTPPGGLFPA
ncbi:hypothetical protein QJS66_01815 [Kocuria rhizophila]|nr:hypothetical protein QJS66_01815 [Kocuria rhizophila]